MLKNIDFGPKYIKRVLLEIKFAYNQLIIQRYHLYQQKVQIVELFAQINNQEILTGQKVQIYKFYIMTNMRSPRSSTLLSPNITQEAIIPHFKSSKVQSCSVQQKIVQLQHQATSQYQQYAKRLSDELQSQQKFILQLIQTNSQNQKDYRQLNTRSAQEAENYQRTIHDLKVKQKQKQKRYKQFQQINQENIQKLSQLTIQGTKKEEDIRRIKQEYAKKQKQINRLNLIIEESHKLFQKFNNKSLDIWRQVQEAVKLDKQKELEIDRNQLNIAQEQFKRSIYSNYFKTYQRLHTIHSFINSQLSVSAEKDRTIDQNKKNSAQKDLLIKRLNDSILQLNEQLEKRQQQYQKSIEELNDTSFKIQQNISLFSKLLDQKAISLAEYLASYLKQLPKIEQQSKLKKASNSLVKFCKIVKSEIQFLKKKQRELQLIEEQKELLKANISKLQTQTTRLKTYTKQIIQQNNYLLIQKQKQQQKLQGKIQYLYQQMEKKKNQFAAKLQSKEASFSQKQKNLQNEILRLGQKNSLKETQNRKMQRQNYQLNEKIQRLVKENTRLVQESTSKIELSTKDNGDLKQLISKLKAKNFNLQDKLSQANNRIGSLSLAQKNLLLDLKNKQSQIENLNHKALQAKQKSSILSKKISQILFLITDKQRQLGSQSIQSIIQQVKLNIFNLLNSAPFLSQSAILDHKKNKKGINFIKNAIEKFKQARITGCQLVYRKDQHKSNVNFHAYLDQTQNLLLIIHLANDRVIGGFTSKPFIKNNTQKHKEGFLFVADTQLTYFMKPDGKQAITYDEYFIIWGNSQIRIRFGEDLVFSNFGILNSYYDNKRDRIDEFLGYENEREIMMKTYEFYKVRL